MFSVIRLYVSVREWVSKGGRPTSMAYLDIDMLVIIVVISMLNYHHHPHSLE